MNFFGHATVACWFGRDAPFVLGAMLPDFASMIRSRIGDVRGARLSRGVTLHHRTDALFHRHPSFARLAEQASRTLRNQGVSRGGAAGAAHVGVELLLDGLLLEQDEVSRAYLGALEKAEAIAPQIRWTSADGPARFGELMARLRATGIPRAYADPDEVARILVTILSRRPALALSSAEAGSLRKTLPGLVSPIRKAAPEILDALRRDLEQGATDP